MFNFKKKKICLEDTFAAGRKFLSHVKESSRAAFSTATLVINVLPWDPAHHPSADGVFEGGPKQPSMEYKSTQASSITRPSNSPAARA